MWKRDLKQMHQYYGMMVTLRGAFSWNGYGKGWKLRIQKWLMCSLCRNEYKILKLAVATMVSGLWRS
jgi:hypothetical protein